MKNRKWDYVGLAGVLLILIGIYLLWGLAASFIYAGIVTLITALVMVDPPRQP